MITISLCMIVKNEEMVIERCLKSVVDLVEEVIIVDTGSVDNTKIIASKYTDKIFDFKWIDDFAAARNFSFSKATQEYILWIDADDVIAEEDREKFLKLKQDLEPSVDSVTMEYNLSKDEYGNPTFFIRRHRLVKRTNNFQWIGVVHEYLGTSGKIFHSDVVVTHNKVHHDSDRNIKIYEKRLSNGEKFSPRDILYYANELFDHKQYGKAVSYYEKFLSDKKGWVEDNISSCGKLADCYHHLGNLEKELSSVLRAFGYSGPRPEFCCRLGYRFLQDNDLYSAISWYKIAADFKPSEGQPFNNITFYTWLPHLQLCVCYSRLGKYKLAHLHNEVAGQYRPNDLKILYNREYLKDMLIT